MVNSFKLIKRIINIEKLIIRIKKHKKTIYINIALCSTFIYLNLTSHRDIKNVIITLFIK